MPPALLPCRCCRGMTLLEIILAMLVLSVVMTMVSLSLSGSFRVVEATQSQGEIYHRAQVALQRISEDLASAMVAEDLPFQGEKKELEGQRADYLRFGSLAHLVFDQEHELPGVGRVTYTVRPDKEEGRELILYRRDTLQRPGQESEAEAGEEELDESKDFLLCDRLQSVQFTFVSREGEEVDSWDSAQEQDNNSQAVALPVAVNCTLTFWLDSEAQTTITFTTSVTIPVGAVQPTDEKKTT